MRTETTFHCTEYHPPYSPHRIELLHLSGTPYPTSWLKNTYREGAPSLVEAAAIQDAEFDVQIEASEFVVAIPSGTTIVDWRDGVPFVARVNEAIFDLAAATDILRDSGFLRDCSQR